MNSIEMFSEAGIPITGCYDVQHAIDFACPECGAQVGDYCTRKGVTLRTPHTKRLLRGRAKHNIKYPFCSGFYIRKTVGGAVLPYAIKKG